MKGLVKILATLLISSSVVFAAEYTIKFSHVVSADTPKGRAADFFAKRVKELTDGKVKVDVYPSSQLYTDKAVMKALKMNSVQMAAPSFSKFTSLVPQLQIFDLPFLFRDKSHLHKVLDSEVGQTLKGFVEKKGYIALNYWDSGFKQLSSNKKALIKPEDAKGQKFRIMSSKVLEEQFIALDANPQVLPFSEVYSALQQGVVDAAENPLANFYTKKFHEVQQYLTMSNHGYLGYLVVASKRFWKKLPADLRTKVTQAMNEATEKERVWAEEEEAIYIKNLQAYGKKSGNLEIFQLTDKERTLWKNKVEKIYEHFYDKKKIGKDLIEKVQKL